MNSANRPAYTRMVTMGLVKETTLNGKFPTTPAFHVFQSYLKKFIDTQFTNGVLPEDVIRECLSVMWWRGLWEHAAEQGAPVDDEAALQAWLRPKVYTIEVKDTFGNRWPFHPDMTLRGAVPAPVPVKIPECEPEFNSSLCQETELRESQYAEEDEYQRALIESLRGESLATATEANYRAAMELDEDGGYLRAIQELKTYEAEQHRVAADAEIETYTNMEDID